MQFRHVRYTSADGVSLFARDYGGAGLTPVLCLPGLTRNSKDFAAVAERLADRRRVVCADFRGRGLSGYTDPATYRPDVEAADSLALIDHLGIARVAIIGTSRGGLVAMTMAATAKQRLAGICFNDIGPKIELGGLLRIRSYLGVDPRFASWDEAVAALKATNPGIEGLDEAAWQAFARRVFRDAGGIPVIDYDPDLGRNFPSTEDIVAGKTPELWEMFDQVAPLPALIVRGANSELLSATTVAEMQRRHTGLAAVTVKDRGHVPFLDEPEAIAAINDWLAVVDAS
ncbi:MAG: alpha/beta hydrolase [Rhizobiales bacterium]|nr:alpha/beta hydrolase [Hyphomicrobiales bacterium]MBI3674741.1 alpha/beta hydrolase [Hyphomicrobiales bacterium]